MTVSILYPEHQYIFNNVQMGLIYDLVCAYMQEAESVEEVALAQETVDSICAQSLKKS